MPTTEQAPTLADAARGVLHLARDTDFLEHPAIAALEAALSAHGGGETAPSRLSPTGVLLHVACFVADAAPWRQSPDLDALKSAVQHYRAALSGEAGSPIPAPADHPFGPAGWWMKVCPECGNKRCPHAQDERYECTGSNEPGQVPRLRGAAPLQPDTPGERQEELT